MLKRARGYLRANAVPLLVGTALSQALWLSLKWLIRGIAEDRFFGRLNAWLDAHWSIYFTAWLFWLAAVVGVIVWAWRQGAKSQMAPAPIAFPRPDMALYDAVDTVKSRVDGNEDVERLFHDALSLGQLQSWARPVKARGESALEPIPPEIWRKRAFVIVRPPGKRRPFTWIAWSGAGGRPYTHSDVRLSSTQVDELWPDRNDEP